MPWPSVPMAASHLLRCTLLFTVHRNLLLYLLVSLDDREYLRNFTVCKNIPKPFTDWSNNWEHLGTSAPRDEQFCILTQVFYT